MQVAEMIIDNTIIRGHDDCFVKTEQERQDILDTIGRIASGIYRDKVAKEDTA